MQSRLPIAALTTVLVLLSACRGAGPQTPVISFENAIKIHQRMELDVLTIYEGMRFSDDPRVTHLVEVLVVDGPQSWKGQQITLPFNQRFLGEPPPRRGASVQTSPSRWVTPNPAAYGSPDRFKPR